MIEEKPMLMEGVPNEFKELLNEFLAEDWHNIDYEFLKTWVGKTDGLITIDGVSLGCFGNGPFNKPYFVLRVWTNGDYYMSFRGATIPQVMNYALLHLLGIMESAFASGYEPTTKTTIQPR